MTESHTEARLRDAMQAIRQQSAATDHGPSTLDDRQDADLPDLEGGHRSPPRRRRWLLPATAAALLLVIAGVVALISGIDERETNVTASRPDRAAARVAAVAQVTEGCRRYQAARPAQPAPVDVAAELTAWLDQYDGAIAEARATLRGVPAAVDDRAVLADADDALVRQSRALDAARVAATSGDTVEAIRLIDQARSYESIAAFELAQWGAIECDARGVTRPTR